MRRGDFATKLVDRRFEGASGQTCVYLGLYEKKESEEVVANMSLRPKSESTVLSVSLPPSVEKWHFINCWI